MKKHIIQPHTEYNLEKHVRELQARVDALQEDVDTFFRAFGQGYLDTRRAREARALRENGKR